MLIHRTNVLLSAEENNLLNRLSQEKNKTKGELIRYALKKTYDLNTKKVNEREKIFNDIRKLAQKVNTKGIDWRALVVEGRKYE